MTEVARQRAIGVLEREWHDMDTWLRSLSESDLDRPVFGEGPGWCVRDGKKPLSDGEAGLMVVRVLELAMRSLRSGGARVAYRLDAVRA